MEYSLNNLNILSALQFKDKMLSEFSSCGTGTANIIGNLQYVVAAKDAIEGTVTFFTAKYVKSNRCLFDACRASLIIVPEGKEYIPQKMTPEQLIVFVPDPKLAVVQMLHKLVTPIIPTFEDNSKIDGYVGPGILIEKGAKIGRNVSLMGNSYIYSNVIIGNNVVIKPGAVIGGSGYQNIFDDNGTLITFPHIGQTIIQDRVRIGSNTCIDRGTLSTTFIGEGTCIDNLVHIGHNVQIGKNCRITANAMLAQSILEDNVWIAPSTNILNGVTIGRGASTGMSSCVTRDVEANTLVYGVPAKPRGNTP